MMSNIEKLNQICIKHLGIDFLEDKDLQFKNFFSKELNIEEREMALILLAIEKELGVRFSDDFLCNSGFENFNAVCNYMKLCL